MKPRSSITFHSSLNRSLMSIFKKVFVVLSLMGVFLVPALAHADDYGLSATANASGIAQRYPSDIPTLIGNVIGTALSMIAVIFFILMVYGGFLWMTAHGDSGQVDKAKDTIVAAIIGIIVVLASYAITNFVFSASSGAGATPTANGGASKTYCLDSSLQDPGYVCGESAQACPQGILSFNDPAACIANLCSLTNNQAPACAQQAQQ